MRSITAIAIAAAIATTQAQQYTGFNYGNKKPSGELKFLQDYLDEFEAARNLIGTGGQYTSARLYTTCSAGRGVFDGEKAALTNVFNTFRPDDLRSLIAGISVGSEDLYRTSDTSAGSYPGEQPGVIAGYMNEIKQLVDTTPGWAGIPVGHVDTWNVWTNATDWPEVSQVIDAADFIGLNGFPYFQASDVNSPENLGPLFAESLRRTQEATGKPVWVTETGFPYYGPTFNLAMASAEVAERYYRDVGCEQLFGKVNTWWYILLDGVDPPPTNPEVPAFGVMAPPLRASSTGPVKIEPIYNLSCTATISTATPRSIVDYESTTLAFASPSLVLPGNDFPADSPSTLVTSPSITSAVGTSAANPVPPSTSSSSPVVASSIPSPSSSMSSSTATSTSTSPSSSACPADLNGPFEFPHLIVPVSSAQPDTAQGTQYFGTIDGDTSTLFNFDIPPSLEGQTCTVIFLLPRPEQLVWSSYDFNSQGSLSISELSGPADSETTFSNTPSGTGNGATGAIQPGSSYVVSSGPCAAGETIGFRVDSVGGLALRYFQDFNPSAPIGLFVRAC